MTESFLPGNVAQPSREGGRRRAGRLAATVLGLTLVAAAAAGCSSGGGSGDQKSDGGSTAAAAPTGITVPGKIGSLTKQAEDPKFGTPDDGIPASVRKNLHSVTYAARRQPYSLRDRGGRARAPDHDRWARRRRRAADLAVGDLREPGQGHQGVPRLGRRHGRVRPEYSSKKHFDCGWVSGKVALVMGFNDFTLDEAKAQVPKFLEAMVTS